MNEAQYPICPVARLTGLSAHGFRIWEQRYRAVEPQRTAPKRRIYSQRDIERLNLLRDVTQAGHSIGHVAKLITDKLAKLVAPSPNFQARAPRAAAEAPKRVPFLEESVAAVKSLDSRLFPRNIINTNRIVRALGALALLSGAGFGFFVSEWLGAGLAVSGVFVLFEALRRWCELRAGGIKNRI